MVRITYKVHDIVIPQANDPTKTISKTVYEAEDHHAESGMIGFTGPDKTIASGAVVLIDSLSVIRGEGASADTLDFITFGATPDINDKDLVWIQQGAEAITIAHNASSPPANSGAILLLSQIDKKMIGTRMVLLQRQGSNFQEIAQDGIVGNGGILVTDDEGNAVIVCGSVPSAVNHIKLTNASTGNAVIVEAIGTDPNIGITITPKGTGRLILLEQIVSNIREATGGAIAIAITAIATAVNFIEVKANVTTSDPEIEAKGSDTNVGIKFIPKGTGAIYGVRETWGYPLTDEGTLPVVGVVFVTEPAPYDMSIDDVIGGLTVAGTGAALFTMDILKENSVNADAFTSIFTTDLVEIDASEFTSTTAATQPNITTSTWEKGRRLQLSITILDSNTLARGAKLAIVTHATAK